MIYLDHNATSPLLPEVLEAMRPWLGAPANPASAHRAGQAAAAAVERARDEVAALVGGVAAGVVFTSGATEANHLFLRGISRPGRLLVSAVEHPCVYAAARASGRVVETFPVDAGGVALLPALDAGVAAVSLMAVNHETGVVQPDVLGAVRAVGALLHVDATQAAGKTDLPQADAIVLSSHKLGGPAGVGALVLRSGDPFPALLSGGAQERGRRAGTVNVAGVVGFAAACRLARLEAAERQARWRRQSERVRGAVLAAGGRIAGVGAVPSTTCGVFPGIAGETLVQALDLRGICVSSGAACASGSLEPSPVLRAMGDPDPASGLRISLGPRTTDDEIAAICRALPDVVAALRA